jgi:hypothetical protein
VTQTNIRLSAVFEVREIGAIRPSSCLLLAGSPVNNNINMLMPVSLMVLHIKEPYWHFMNAAFWPMQLASLGIIPPTEDTQILVLRLWYYDSVTCPTV